jgi:5-methylcytosine-specific restriction enzyme B
MSIPKNITKDHLLQAISKIDDEGIPSDGASRFYDVIFNGIKYPPKLIVSFANLFANGEIIDRNSFAGGIGTQSFKLLEENGFIIQKKSNAMSQIPAVWIEKSIVEGRADRQTGERALGKALWSTQRDKRGADIYKNMRLVQKGDIVLHLINRGNISGISIVRDKVIEVNGLQGTDWAGSGYLVNLDSYTELSPQIIRSDLLNEKNKRVLIDIAQNSEVFYNINLDLRQGAYLTPCPDKLLRLINDIYFRLSNTYLPFLDEIEPFLVKTNGSPMKNQKYFLSIKTKPFIILAGLSGTGKSRLVRTLAYKFDNIEEDRLNEKHPPSNFQIIKVRPNWHDSSDLLGYESRISGKERFIVTEFIRFLVKAKQHPETPFFLCLDEMNLAPVEQYFAEYLSVLESRRGNNMGTIKTDTLISSSLITKYAEKADGVDLGYNLWGELSLSDPAIQAELKTNGLGLPPNLIVIGTVNMDETTYSFSRKVLDRAMTVEMNEIDLLAGLDDESDDWSYPEKSVPKELVLSEKTQGSEVFSELGKIGEDILEYLNQINEKLEGSPFKVAYRVRDEFLLYTWNFSSLVNKPDDWLNQVLDDMTLMKILPRIEGDADKTKLLDDLKTEFETRSLVRSLKKTVEMIKRRNTSHYTSYWI